MLKQRILTALVIGPLTLAGVFLLPEFWFGIFIGSVITIAAWEWANLASYDGAARFAYAGAAALLMAGATLLPPVPVLVLAVLWWLCAIVLVITYPESQRFWAGKLQRVLIGLLVLVPGVSALLVLKRSANPDFLILLLFFLIWGADVGAYFAGKAFGRVKMLPAVSPGKSWAGLYGGIVVALLIAAGFCLYLGKPDLTNGRGMLFLGICLLVILVSVMGDLTISMFKRFRGIKDSSQLLPGHGGFLDRIDSMLAAGPVFSLAILFYGWV